MKSRIFLDYASTTPLDPATLKVMMPYYKKHFGNPSSAHSFGQKAKAAIEGARENVARLLGCQPTEVFFTSGATEANTSVIHGVAEACEERKQGLKPHIVVSAIEHESVLAPIRRLERAQRVEATYVSPGNDGIVRASDIVRAVRPHTALVSVMYVNSEIGTIQPVAEIGEMLVKRPPSVFGFKTLFHTDAVQAAYWLECSPATLNADFLTLSGHKIYGPKGVGMLYKKEGVPFVPLLRGGGQEYAMRSGTENVAGIVGCGEAVRSLFDPKMGVARIRVRQVRDKIIRGVLKRIGGASLTGPLDRRVSGNAHFLFEGVDGRDLMLALDREGFAVSTGSACSENTREASHVLIAMGVSPQDALGALRVTVGKQTKAEDADKFIGALAAVLKRVRTKQ